MAGRDIDIPFGPDKTGGIPLEALDAAPLGSEPRDAGNGAYGYAARDPYGANAAADPYRANAAADAYRASAAVEPYGANAVSDPYRANTAVEPYGASAAPQPYGAESAYPTRRSQAQRVTNVPYVPAMDVPETDIEEDSEYHAGGMSDDEAVANGMDAMQMSILAFRESIGQGRELKALEKDRKELAEALEADHEELADRENILNNYVAIVTEQDDIVDDCTRQREASKATLSQVTAEADAVEARLNQVREHYAVQMQPVEAELGRVKADADRAKNDERSRKAELSSAESELRRAKDSNANTMALSRHQIAEEAYRNARRESEKAKEQLAQVQAAYNDAKQEADQAMAPLERNLNELNRRIDSLKQEITSLGEEISTARKRRQYCDTVYQYPEETRKMSNEVAAAEEAARQMDIEIHQLSERLAQNKQQSLKAKIALVVVIVIIIVIVVSFVLLMNR